MQETDYRILRIPFKERTGVLSQYAIYQVWYSGDRKVSHYGDDPISIMSWGKHPFEHGIRLIQEAITKPILLVDGKELIETDEYLFGTDGTENA